MGLDMYLNKKTYIGNNWKKPEERKKFGINGIKDERVTTITEQVGYWRKANHIHNWFVENVQDGEDDCKEYYVSREKLQKLLETVKLVLKSVTLKPQKIQVGTTWSKDKGEQPIMEDGGVIENTGVAEELLPTTSGFFFGGTNYDNYYVESLKETQKILENVLKENDGDFYYEASW